MALEQRIAAANDVIRLDGTLLYTFKKAAFEIGINGTNKRWMVGKPPKQSSFEPEVIAVTAGTAEADLWGKEGDGPARVICRLVAGKSNLLNLPGRDLQVKVVAVATPVPTPPPVHVDPAPTPQPTDVMPTPPQGMQVVRLTSADVARTLVLKSNTWYAPPPGQTRFPINADTGCKIPSGATNVRVFGVDFVGNGDKGYGIDARSTKGITDVEFIGGSCRNFTNGASIHSPTIEGPNVHKGVAFRNWRFMDTAGTGDTEGQGIYAANIDGLTLENVMFSNIGRPPVRIWTHGAYIAAGCRRVVVRACMGFKVEHGLIWARGAELRYGDPDSGDAGPLIDGLISYDAAVAVFMNGRRGTIRNLTALAGHHSDQPNTLGGCAIWASVGDLTCDGGLLISSPVKAAGYTEQWHNSPRDDADWGYRGACKTTGTNVTKLEVVVDLSDLERRGRAGEPIGPLYAEGQARCRKAAGVN